MKSAAWTEPIALGPEHSLQLDGKSAGAVGYHRVEMEEPREGEDLARFLHGIVQALEVAVATRFPHLNAVRRHVTVEEYPGQPRPVWVVRVWVEKP